MILVGFHDTAVFVNLGQRRLVRPHGNPVTVFLLRAGLSHAQEHVRVVILLLHGVSKTRVALVRGQPLPLLEFLLRDSEYAVVFFAPGDLD